MKTLTSKVLFKASPVVLAVALGFLGPAALNDDEEDASVSTEAPSAQYHAGLDAPDLQAADPRAER